MAESSGEFVPGIKVDAQYLEAERKPTTIKLASRRNFEAGGRQSKALIEATVGERPISLIQRPYSEHIVKFWQSSRDAGLPVVPTLRQITMDGEQSLLYTDVKADGSEVYGKALKKVLSSGFPRERPPEPSVDRHFLEITNSENLPDVVTRANEISMLATERGLRLPVDDA